jgi:hypothetical protein
MQELLSARFVTYDPREGARRFWLCERHMAMEKAELGEELVVNFQKIILGTCEECLREREGKE